MVSKRKEYEEHLELLRESHPKGKELNADGSEFPDPVPMAPPVGYKKQPSMFEVIRSMISQERMRILEEEGFESPEDADDLAVDEEDDPSSPYEYDFDHIVDPAEFKRLRDAIDVRERELRDQASGASAGSHSDTAKTGGEAAPPKPEGKPPG